MKKLIDRRAFLKLSTTVAGSAMLAGSTAGSKSSIRHKTKQPNLLFVFADQWRRHSLGFMKEDPVFTPRLDAFAQDARVFTNALTCSPICSPYRATLITGRYPLSNTVICNNILLPESETTIADVLKKAGYATGYIGKWHLDGEPWDHFTPPGPRRQGFDFWYANGCFHQHFLLHYWGDSPEPFQGAGWQPDHETDVAIDFLERQTGDKPFALFMSWAPPHTIHGGPRFDPQGEQSQYSAPERFEALYRGKELPRRANVPDRYADYALPGHYGAITSLDENFGRLLDYLEQRGLMDNTIVVFTSDHGEMLGSHRGMTKGVWYEESIGIPFLIRWPGNIAPGLDDRLFNSVDVMPSLLGLMGQKIPKTVEGTDQSAAMRGESAPRPQSALVEFFMGTPDEPANGRPWRCLRTERYSYIIGQHQGVAYEQLYDNETDPYQMTPKEPEAMDPALRQRLRGELGQWLRRTNDPWARYLV